MKEQINILIKINISDQKYLKIDDIVELKDVHDHKFSINYANEILGSHF